MHIAFVIPYFYPAWQYGGPPRSAYELARELIRRGHEVTVFTTDTGGRSRLAKERTNSSVDGVEIVHLRNLSNYLAFRHRVSLVPGLTARLRADLPDVDVVHVHEFRSMLTVAAFNACGSSTVPYVLSPHGGLRPMGKVLLKRFFDRVWGQRILQGAGRIAVVSPLEATQVEEAGVQKDRIDTIPNPLSAEPFEVRRPAGEFRRRWSIARPKIILFLARLHWIKGADLLVRALSGIVSGRNDTHLVLAGPDDGQEAEVRRLIAGLGLGDSVTFTGFLDEDQKISAFTDATVTVVASRSEIFSLTVLESLLCRTPVLVSSACGLFPMPGYDHGAIQFGGGDVGDLSRKLASAIDDVRLADNAVRGREFAMANFGVDRIAGLAERMYGKAIGIHQE